ESASVTAFKWGSKFWVTARKELIKLDTRFVNAVLDDSNFTSDEQWARFFRQYGTHYPLHTLYGGKAYYEETMTAKEVVDSITKTQAFSAEATIPVRAVDVGLSGGFNTADQAAMTTKKSQQKAVYFSIGGQGGNFDTWDVGEKQNAWVPIRVDLRPIYEL